MKHKRRTLSAVTLVKEMSRAHIGKVPGLRVIPDKRFRPPKHRKQGEQ